MSNLSSKQFEGATDVEAQRRRHESRRGLYGSYVGIGGNFANYPYMIGAMGTGGAAQMDNELHEPNAQDEHSEDAGSMAGEPSPGASDTTGMGDGGTAAAATGAAGGSPA